MADYKSDSSIWVKKCIPKKTKDVYGQDSAVSQLKNFIQTYSRQKKKAMILYGPTGSGKTCSVYAAANELGCEILEVNASDCRNADSLNSIVGSALKQRSLFFRSKVILVDELDGVSGSNDRGGIPALQSLIVDSVFPIIMTANDPFDKKFSTLRSKSVLVEFSPLDSALVFQVLKNICTAEKIIHDDDSLKSLARRSGGDLRGAITDLQTVSSSGKIVKDDILLLSDREHEEAIENALLKIFKTTDERIALGSFDYVSENIDECFLWLEENIPLEYETQKDIAAAFDCLSKADVLRGRIRRWQHWRFLSYISEFLTAGIAVSKDVKYKKIVKYQRTTRILAIWIASSKNKRRKDIASKIAESTHTSTKRALTDTLPYLRVIFSKSKDKVLLSRLTHNLGLDAEDVEYLKK